ncbi:non-ribosomal peptide synthetase, partial [Pseudoalteromonas sp. BMB]|uniref:non-ribosomal peptide synthetase n=1 Tax=Pseudoalteromonas sp. BMB TaxID=1874619 RepID=UPI0011130154
VINEYGPTETTVGSTQFRVTNELTGKKSVSIGKSIQNTQIRLLDREANLVPIGAIGEMHIGGDGLARGYLNNAQLTAEKFIAWRHTALDGSVMDQRLYKTGDLARVLPDGNLEFVGRNDDQVKVRGYRIELGDIEHHLCAAPHVESGVVLLNKLGEDNKSLLAYVKLSSIRKGNSELDSTETSLQDIWSYLESNVPSFMMPGNLIVVADWPTTPNGKVDKRALLNLKNSHAVDKQCQRPQSPTEIQLAQIWAELLNVDMSTIAVDQNLLKLGGDSLLIIRMMVQIKKQFDIKPELQQVYDMLTIRQLAAYLDQLINIKDKEKIITEETVEQEGWF